MKIVPLAFSVFALCGLIYPAQHASALGPVAGDCNWGNYSKANTTYLSPNSGESNQTQINSALASAPSGGSVYLKSGTYTISGSILVKSNVILEGDKDAVVKLKSHAGWTYAGGLAPLIGSAGNKSVQNVEIKCFTVDGNYSFNKGNQSSNGCWKGIAWNSSASAFAQCESASGGDRYHGKGYYTMMAFNNSSSLSVHDMVMQDSAGDGCRVQGCSGVKFYNNFVNAAGHEAFFANVSHGIEVYNNNMVLRASGGARGDDCYDYVIHDNVFESYNHKDSGAGVQIDNKRGTTIYNVQIYRNVFRSIWQAGIWFSVWSGSSSSSVLVHHNIFYGNGISNNSGVGATGGIVAASAAKALVYNNVFDGNLGAGVNGGGSGLKVVSNIIVNSKAGNYGGAGRGAGVTGTSDVNYNCFNGNAGGDGTSASSNGHGDPLFADQGNQDYHLKSKAGRWDPTQKKWVTDSVNSPCIDWGIPLSVDSTLGDYSKEPTNNGSRVNAGVYGDTTQASLTGNSPQSPVPPDPKEEDYPKGFDGGGDTGGGGENTPIWWNPTESLIDPDPFVSVDFATGQEEKELAPLFPQLDNAPSTATADCTVTDADPGFIPCGRSFDSSKTPWNECKACNFCHLVLMGQLTIEYLIKLAAVAATLFLILAGFLYVFAAGKQELIIRAKQMIKHALLGFVIIFVAWAIVDSILATLGYIDPIGGSWYSIC